MIEQLTKQELKDIFSSKVYHRGLDYFKKGLVRDLIYDPVRSCWIAKVRGSKIYSVIIEEDELGILSECNCPAYDQYSGPCKHIAAVMLTIYEQYDSGECSVAELKQKDEERQAIYTKQLTNQFIHTISTYSLTKEESAEEKEKSLLLVEWILKVENRYHLSNPILTLEMKVGQKRTYVVKNIKDFLRAIVNERQYPFTKNFTYDPTEQRFSEEDQEILYLLQEAREDEELYWKIQNGYYHQSGDERTITIPPRLANDLLKQLNNRSIRFNNNKEEFAHIRINEEELPFSMRLDKRKKEGYEIDLTEMMNYTYLDLYGYLLADNVFYPISDDQQVFVKELDELINQVSDSVLPIANDQIEPFLSQVVPVMEGVGSLEITEDVSDQIVKVPLQAKAYVDLIDNMLYVSLEFYYGKHQVNPFSQVPEGTNGPIIVRDVEIERTILSVIEAAPLKFNVKGLYVEGEENIFEFLHESLPKLEEKVDIYLTNAVKSFVLPNYQSPVTNIEVSPAGNLLEISFDMEGIDSEEIQKMLQLVREKKKYHRLPNGTFVSLESEEFQTIGKVISEFNIKPQQLEEQVVSLPMYRGIQLDEILNKEKVGSAKYGKQFRRLLNRLKNPEELDFELPAGLQAELRDYQRDGFQWLRTLRTYNLGGILADDMGLGKTLQSIALLLSIFEENAESHPALIVAPASLVYNWKNEFEKFAPKLSVEVLIGSPQERVEKLAREDEPNVWITSYHTLRQDIEHYKNRQFSAFILDEAQAIKNNATKTAKSIRQVQAETILALSGTPIENSIDELWSIFQTVMPGFFPAQKQFRQLEPEKVATMIRPFLLRRVKKDVLTELPDKIETVTYSDLTKKQKELYVGYLEQIQQETKESLQVEGFQKSRIKILAGLTRLRQLCCHPSLFIEDYTGGSGKLEQLMEVITNAVENGRRILVFSQFTSMLAIIRERLTAAGFDLHYLDGQTKSKTRVEMVEEFNQGKGDLFLISLKAGNTGLNLTGADTVILYDLWWNPAVEEQAAGRAHRLGQKNVVQVIRLITQGTIEEKINALQQKKKELIDSIVQPGAHDSPRITEEEIKEILSIGE